jgi:hypothetical protein
MSRDNPIPSYLGYTAIFLGLAVFYFLWNGFYAFHPTDDGFILGYSWRIFNGEMPYRDFIYMCPPLTPYLHSLTLWLPEGWQFMANRFLAYLQLSTIIALPSFWAVSARYLKISIFNLALTVIFFFITISFFPPMPWYTIDGLMFSFLGLTLLLFPFSSTSLFKKILLAGLASLSIVMAALCKQSFLFVWPALGIGHAFISIIELQKGNIKKSHLLTPQAAYWITGSLIFAGFYLWLILTGTMTAFIDQVSGVSTARDFIKLGILPYLSIRTGIVFAAGLACAAIIYLEKSRPHLAILHLLQQNIRAIILLSIVLLAMVSALSDSIDPVNLGLILFWFLLGAFTAYTFKYFTRYSKTQSPRLILLYAGILIVAWAASLSGGYNTPLLGLAPAFLILTIELGRVKTSPERLKLITSPAYVVLALVIIVTYSYLNYAEPYRDLARPQLTYNLADIYPKFGDVSTNEVTYNEFEEIEKLKADYIGNQSVPYVIMPDFPIYYFIAGARNPTCIDWFICPVHLNQDSQIIEDLSEKKPLVFLEKTYGAPVADIQRLGYMPDEERKIWYSIPYWVHDNWTKIGEGEYFYVYKSPE